MTRNIIISFAGLFMLSAAIPAAANPSADANADGMITQSEFIAVAQEQFAKTDTNGDGYITREEQDFLKNSRQDQKTSEYFDRVDQNRDGVISRSEFEAGLNERRSQAQNRRAQRKDTITNGAVSREDRAKMRQQFSGKSDMIGRNMGAMDRYWDRIDTNSDGLISAQEHLAGANKMFEHLDADGDGVLVQGEGKRKTKRKRRGFFKR